jgi:hypothetical protein
MHVAIEVPRNIMDIVKLRAQQEHLDEKATLKQLLCMGAEKYLAERYSEGEISIEKMAELLGVDLYMAHEILEKYHIKSSISYSRFVKGISNVGEI